MIELASFWKRESKKDSSRTYWTGRMGRGRLLLFTNEHKTEDKHPDLILYVVEERGSVPGDD